MVNLGVANERLRFPTQLLVGVAIALLSACVRYTGIDHENRELTVPTAVEDTHYDAWPDSAWWQSYQDPVLNDLIEHALRDNPNIQIAEARLRAARAAGQFVDSKLKPHIEAGFDSKWQRFTEHGMAPDFVGGHHDTDNRLALDFDYELDLFGRNRALSAGTAAQIEAQQAATHTARVAITSAVARAYFALAKFCAEEEVIGATLAQRARILELVKARVALGVDSNVELRQAEGAIPRIQSEREKVVEHIELLRDALSKLAVVPFAATTTIRPQLGKLAPPHLPAVIPSDFISRRADVTAARWRVESTLKGVEAVKSEFYPSVNLAAFAGFSALGLGALLESGSQIYGIAPAIRLPIFDADRLRAKLKFTNAQTDVAIAEYNGTLISAMGDVVHAVISIRALEQRATAQRAAQAAAESAYDLALQRFKAGLTGYLTVLATEGEVLTERRAATSLKARAYELDVALKRALGGGYAADAVIARR